jgi:3-oxoacyl-(acyl-carrier-protein) synthase
MNIYIYAIAHISNQEPLSEAWFRHPLIHNARYVRSMEPNFTAYLSPMVARRMGKVVKRALVTTLEVIDKTGINQPDAIITGTGLGCIENTEKFLTALLDNNEKMLPPTCFMQSTHNTISSQIAVHLKCTGYNSTYSHRGTSFDSALLDAYMQFELGAIGSALVSGHDELTPNYFRLLDKTAYWKEGEITEAILRKGDTKGSFAGECSVSFMLGNTPKATMVCELKAIELMYKPTDIEVANTLASMLQRHQLTMAEIDALVVGISGDESNDAVYKKMHSALFPTKPMVWYKHIFGESFTASGLGLYVAATILQKAAIAPHLVYRVVPAGMAPIRNIIVYNHFQNKDHSLTLLSSCSD